MKALKRLSRGLQQVFRPTPTRKPDPFRRQREQAKALAKEHAIEIEALPGGGYNVWPPKSWVGEDPLDGDHYGGDWDEVLTMVEQYVRPAQTSRPPRP